MNAHATFEPRHVQHRRYARVCASLAEDAASPLDRWTLLTMQQSWLALAENEEWLAGRSPRRARAAPPLKKGTAARTRDGILGLLRPSAKRQHIASVRPGGGFAVGGPGCNV